MALVIEELRNAFELAERTSPGISDHFVQNIMAKYGLYSFKHFMLYQIYDAFDNK